MGKYLCLHGGHVYRSLYVNKSFIKYHIKMGDFVAPSYLVAVCYTDGQRVWTVPEDQAEAAVSPRSRFTQCWLSPCTAVGESHKTERENLVRFQGPITQRAKSPLPLSLSLSPGWFPSMLLG